MPTDSNGPLIVVDDTGSAESSATACQIAPAGPKIWSFWTAAHCLPGRPSKTTPGPRCGYGIVHQGLGRDDSTRGNDDTTTWFQDSFVDWDPAQVQTSTLAIFTALQFAVGQCERLSPGAHMPVSVVVFVDSIQVLGRIATSWNDSSTHLTRGRTSCLRWIVRTIRSLGVLGVKVQLRRTLGIREDIRHRWARQGARNALDPVMWEESVSPYVQRVCRRTRRATLQPLEGTTGLCEYQQDLIREHTAGRP
jgi:hypothetical protein